MPRVSIIIPTHCRPHLLARAVESARAAGTDIEVIVVDDASIDQTSKVGRTLDGIKYIRLEHNQGVGGARNVGVAASSAEYVAFLDDDDLRLPGSLDVQVEALERHPEVGFICGQMLLSDQDGKLTGEISAPTHPGGDAFWELLELDFPVMPISVVIRKSCFTRVGLFNSGLQGIDDWDILVRIAEVYPVLVLNQPVSIYRHPTPFSSQGSSAQAAHLARAARHQLRLLRLPRAMAAPISQRLAIRRRTVNRIVDTLIRNAADRLEWGALRFAAKNLLTALYMSPARTLRPRNIRGLASLVFSRKRSRARP